MDPYPVKLIYLNFQPLEDVSRYRNPQSQVVEYYMYLIWDQSQHILMFKHPFHSQ